MNYEFHEYTSFGRRALIAAALVEGLRAERRSKKTAIRAWVACARKGFTAGCQKPCDVCHRYRDVAHAHHLVPLWWQAKCGFDAPVHSFVWLCPTHHAAVHISMDAALRNRMRDISGPDSFPPTECDSVHAIAGDGVRLFLAAGGWPFLDGAA